MDKAIFNWSGGKDSALALYKILKQKEYGVEALVTSVSEVYNRVSMHGVRVSLLDKQAQSIGVSLHKLVLPEMPSMESYNHAMEHCMSGFIDSGIHYSIFGDIFLEDLREYREKQLAKVGMKAVFPLWKRNSAELIKKFIDLDFKTIVTVVDERYLDSSFAGRIIDETFLRDLPENVDPCGENGEFHTFVFDGPLFKVPVRFITGEKTYKRYRPAHNDKDSEDNCYHKTSGNEFDTGFWYCDLIEG